MLTKHRMS